MYAKCKEETSCERGDYLRWNAKIAALHTLQNEDVLQLMKREWNSNAKNRKKDLNDLVTSFYVLLLFDAPLYIL